VAVLDTYVSVRLVGPDLIVQNKLHTLALYVYQGKKPAVPSEASVSVYNASNSAVVDAQGMTVAADGKLTYAIAAATTSGEARGEGWRVEYAITLGGVVHHQRNTAALIKHELHPVVTSQDLYRRVKALDPDGDAPITRYVDHQDFVDDAWTSILDRLLAAGTRYNLVMDPWVFRESHIALALSRIYDDIKSRPGASSEYADDAERYREEYDAAWDRLTFTYDTDDDGRADGDGKRRTTRQTLWLGRG